MSQPDRPSSRPTASCSLESRAGGRAGERRPGEGVPSRRTPRPCAFLPHSRLPFSPVDIVPPPPLWPGWRLRLERPPRGVRAQVRRRRWVAERGDPALGGGSQASGLRPTCLSSWAGQAAFTCRTPFYLSHPLLGMRGENWLVVPPERSPCGPPPGWRPPSPSSSRGRTRPGAPQPLSRASQEAPRAKGPGPSPAARSHPPRALALNAGCRGARAVLEGGPASSARHPGRRPPRPGAASPPAQRNV